MNKIRRGNIVTDETVKKSEGANIKTEDQGGGVSGYPGGDVTTLIQSDLKLEILKLDFLITDLNKWV